MGEREQAWSDPDRRDDALARLQVRIDGERGDLTPAELLALSAASHGLTEAETGVVLGWSQSSVHDRLARARRILGAKTTPHAVAEALRHGLIG